MVESYYPRFASEKTLLKIKTQTDKLSLKSEIHLGTRDEKIESNWKIEIPSGGECGFDNIENYGEIYVYGEMRVYGLLYNEGYIKVEVPEWELERTIKMWMERLERANVLAEEKEKHMEKLKAVLK